MFTLIATALRRVSTRHHPGTWSAEPVRVRDRSTAAGKVFGQMANRRVVISGASIAGLSAAFWLRSTGWDVTVLERADAFRDGGQNIDVRGVAREVLTRMGLFDAVKAQNTTETGTVFVDDEGEVLAELPTDDPDGATAELEVLRGDLARTILDRLPADVEIGYGDPITQVTDSGEGVVVVCGSGRELRADLLVVAEGVRSGTRDQVLGAEVERHELGVTMVFGTIDRQPTDDRRWRWLTTTGGRQVHLRPDNHGTTRAILAYADTGDDEPDLAAMDTGAALADVRRRYAGVGWEAARVLDGFDASDDVYIDRLTQIRMPVWHHGRICFSGDAAWCVTPMGGGGCSLALTSGYVLAAELSRDQRIDGALDAWESWMRPLVEHAQKLPPGLNHFAYPRTAVGLKVRRVADKVLTSAPFAPLVAKVTHLAETDQQLPEIEGVT
jgi:2-polyprenyl-6-methoxyphenol hydroxylase-like FAD-dependent oxidoreductase